MTNLAALITLAFVGALWLTKALASPRAAFRILDTPNERSLHARAMPRTGGVAILLALVGGVALAVVLARTGSRDGAVADAARDFLHRDLLTTIGAVMALAAVSLWNDRHEMSPGLRLLTQGLAAFAVMWLGDLTITSFSVPFFGVLTLGWTSYLFTFLFIVWMTNLYNFMDGMDGFAGGMTVIGFGFLGGLALTEHAGGLGALALLAASAAAGFLVFNFPPARIFMGDVGAVPLGFLASALAVKGNRDNVIGLWVPVLIFSPFIVDATAVLLRRLLTGKRVWEPHREHYYQRLVLAGWSHRRTVRAEYALMVMWGILAVVYKRQGEIGHVVVLAVGVVVYAALAYGVRAVERRNRGLRLLRTAG
jgi:UDP-N-acetylmuramyl pentapeptide phosphotransferase/UDP-N-acetylglucosamine-1-phosphate transferase